MLPDRNPGQTPYPAQLGASRSVKFKEETHRDRSIEAPHRRGTGVIWLTELEFSLGNPLLIPSRRRRAAYGDYDYVPADSRSSERKRTTTKVWKRLIGAERA